MRRDSQPHYYDNLPLSLHKDADALVVYLDSFPVSTPSGCYHCESKRIRIENRTKAGAVGYICISCRKRFNRLTGTSFARIWFPEKWGDFGYWRLSGLPLPKIAPKIGISSAAATIRDEKFHIVMEERFPALHKWWMKHLERQDVKLPRQVEAQKEIFNAFLSELQYCSVRLCPVCKNEAKQIITPTANLDRPEFYCNFCRKAFNPLKETLFYRMNHIKQWIPYVDYLIQGLTNKEMSSKLGITATALISWRRTFFKQMDLLGLDALKGWIKWQESCIRRRARLTWKEQKKKIETNTA